MKKTVKLLISLTILIFGSLISISLAQVISSRQSTNNTVPDYYYANYKFKDDWDAILDRFSEVGAMYSTDTTIPSSKFRELSEHFDKVFPHLTKDFSDTYHKCSILAKNLSYNYSDYDMKAFMGNSCRNSLKQVINQISSSYTVIPSITANPSGGPAPLTVTFDGRGSSDASASQETLPVDNFYRYYRDEKGVDRPIGEGQVLNYTFKESGKFVVHFVVRSSNVDFGILDGEKNLTIDVSPKATDIVVYANTRRMSSTSPLKIGITEGEKGVVFDGSLTKPRGGNKIKRHIRKITNTTNSFSYDSKRIDGSPTYINVPLKGAGTFKVTLTTEDNQNNTVSESFEIYMSDPVTIIKQSPLEGTTSTIFNFDGSASYSITSKLDTYIWEVFDSNGDEQNGNKITMKQGKKLTLDGNTLRPGYYLVRLTVTDINGNQNEETSELYVESSTPVPQFTIVPTSKREKPSEFTLDASNTTDLDVKNGFDSLDYKWEFSTENYKITSVEDYNSNKKIVVQFNETGKHKVRLIVTDQYGKTASVSKDIEVKSTLRPEFEVKPGPITWGKTITCVSTVNRKVWDYTRDFGDRTDNVNSQHAKNIEHIYQKKGIYSIKLTVSDEDGDSNTVYEKAFIGENNWPIAAYKVENNGYKIQTTDVCRFDNGKEEEAYSVDRYSVFSINPSISVNTKGDQKGLKYEFEKQSVAGDNRTTETNLYKTSFNETGCHYVNLAVTDKNIGLQDKVQIWFNVKNALPTIDNVTLAFPQYIENNNTFGFTFDNNSNKSIFDCSGTNNLTIQVTAVNPKDSDGNISRLKFYYYNIDDPDRILEYKESFITTPYVYFVIPRIAGEYKFGVYVYDNDGGMIDSDDYLASNPSVYFPEMCGDAGVPSVTLKSNHSNIQVGDEVTYTIVSHISTDNEDFPISRTFYYDFTGDGEWDLMTNKDTATYTFTEAYEDGITPRAAVEYRGKLGQAEGRTIFVKNGIKPILLYNSIGNTVIFRDLSIGLMQEREICFEVDECKIGNKKYKKSSISPINPDGITKGTQTEITEKDRFLWTYDKNGTHKVSIYFKNKYGMEVTKEYDVKTSSNPDNGKLAPGVNMITIPETTFNNSDAEIFLSKDMNNSIVMYINNDSGETCYVDKDISRDSDGDGKTDNDMDIMCNKMVKIVYEPDFESTIGRVYFMDDGKLTFKNFYITFEGVILELDDEKKELYNEISTLINGLEDSRGNSDLKSSLDRLRKNLNNRSEITSLVLKIKQQIKDGEGITMSLKQKDLLDSIIGSLENEDTVVLVGMSEYETNKQEILALLPTYQGSTIKSTVEKMFESFDENSNSYTAEKRSKELESIWTTIIKDAEKNKYDKNDFSPYFCNIFDYYDIAMYTKMCGSDAISITETFDKVQTESSNLSNGGLPLWLKIILIILVGGLLTMGGIIVFFSIKAKLNSVSENNEDEG